MYKNPLSYNPIDDKRISEILARYEGKHHNALIDDFEKYIREYTGARFVVAMNSGTAAIHLALKVLGVGVGQEVLVSNFTYVGSVNPIFYVGAIPVFIDCENTTGNMDPALVKQAIEDGISRGKKPGAIIVVHSMGVPADMDKIWALGRQFGIPIIEDAAEAFGAFYKENHVGTQSEVGILSFNTNKLLTTYGGGALLTNDELVFKKVLHWSNQAREDKPYYEHAEVGYSYRMGPINAAVGLAEADLFEDKLSRRRNVVENYKAEFKAIEHYFLGGKAPYLGNNWMIPLILPQIKRTKLDDIYTHLTGMGIEVRYLWNPMSNQPAFRSFQSYLNGQSQYFYDRGLCLPTAFDTEQQQADLVGQLCSFIT